MNEQNPYAPPIVDEPPEQRFVPNEVDYEMLKNETLRAYQSHRKKLLPLGVVIYLYGVAQIVFFLTLPFYMAICFLLSVPVINFFANIYVFELVKNGRCTARQWLKNARCVFLFRWASLYFIAPRILLIFPILYWYFHYVVHIHDTYTTVILGCIIIFTQEQQGRWGGYFVMDVQEKFYDAFKHPKLLIKSKKNNKGFTKMQIHLMLSFLWYTLFTLTIGLIRFFPYQYVVNTVFYLTVTEDYRQKCLETLDF